MPSTSCWKGTGGKVAKCVLILAPLREVPSPLAVHAFCVVEGQLSSDRKNIPTLTWCCLEELRSVQKCLDIRFDHYPPDRAIADGLLDTISATLVILLIAARLDKAAPDSVNHLWNFRRWDSIEGNELNNKVTNPVLNPTIGVFNPFGSGAFVVLPDSVDCFLDCSGANASSPIAPHLQPTNVSRERRDSVGQLRTVCGRLLEFFFFGFECLE